MPIDSGGGFLALRDRAHAFVVERGSVSESELLDHVYGGRAPAAVRARLAEPLSEDPRLERGADGYWAIKRRSAGREPFVAADAALTILAVAATGANPRRARVVSISALHVRGGATVERFSATVHPDGRVPRYVAERLGLETAVLDDLPPFETVLDDLLRFLQVDTRPILAQDAHLTWSFLDAEARRAGRILVEPLLLDANDLATRALHLTGKPSLALVAAVLGIGTVRPSRPDEEARVLGLVASRLLATDQGRVEVASALEHETLRRSEALRRGATASDLVDEPGVYVMRDAQRQPLYVGKARRLRSRVAAYINRPLGPTRRLEGLVGAVEAVDPTQCATDLEALVLEDREIRRLQPRFNTARQQHLPKLWIRLPPRPEPRAAKRQPRPRRLESSLGPGTANGELVGPFRNETAAEGARRLARLVFDLDSLRSSDPSEYEARLEQAWRFLRGDNSVAQAFARARSHALLRAVLDFDQEALLLAADPRTARYAVLRPSATGMEGFIVDRGVFSGYATLHDDDSAGFAAELLRPAEPRTTVDDVAVVLRWLGAQRPPTVLVCLADEPQAAADALEDACASLLASRSGDS